MQASRHLNGCIAMVETALAHKQGDVQRAVAAICHSPRRGKIASAELRIARGTSLRCTPLDAESRLAGRRMDKQIMTKPKSLFERFHAVPATNEPQSGGMLQKSGPDGTGSDPQSDGRSELATKLERVSEKALNKADEILDLPLPSADHASFGAVLRAQNAAANTVLNTQTKVDENRLRVGVVDKLPELLEILREEEIKYALRRASVKNE